MDLEVKRTQMVLRDLKGLGDVVKNVSTTHNTTPVYRVRHLPIRHRKNKLNRNQFFLVLIVCFLHSLFSQSSTAHATIQPTRNLDQMILGASDIVRGRVVHKRFMLGTPQKYIYTEITLQLIETYKGTAQRSIRLHVLGGKMPERSSYVAGSARYTVGEEVVVFLEPKRHPVLRFVLGMAAGKYNVYQKDGRSFLHRSLQGLAFYKSSQKGRGQIHEPMHSEAPLRLRKLQDRIRQVQKKTQKAPPVQLKRLDVPSNYTYWLQRMKRLQKSPSSQAHPLPRLPFVAPRPVVHRRKSKNTSHPFSRLSSTSSPKR